MTPRSVGNSENPTPMYLNEPRKQDPNLLRTSQPHSLSTSSPFLSPITGLDLPLFPTILDDPFSLGTPASPSSHLNISSPFREILIAKSPSDPEDTEDLSGLRSTSLTPVFKVTSWGVSPANRTAANSISRVTVSNSPAGMRETDSELVKLEQFIAMLRNPPSHLSKETQNEVSIADYAATLDKLIGY